MKKTKIFFISLVLFMIIGVIVAPKEEEKNEASLTEQKIEESNVNNDPDQDVDVSDEQHERPNDSFHNEAVENSLLYPAEMGRVLVTKGDFDFTNMNYFFEGEFIGSEEDPSTGQIYWLIKNTNEYVMPVVRDAFFDDPNIGDIVSVYGKLTGRGFVPDVENVVGQTGVLFAYKVYVGSIELE